MTCPAHLCCRVLPPVLPLICCRVRVLMPVVISVVGPTTTRLPAPTPPAAAAVLPTSYLPCCLVVVVAAPAAGVRCRCCSCRCRQVPAACRRFLVFACRLPTTTDLPVPRRRRRVVVGGGGGCRCSPPAAAVGAGAAVLMVLLPAATCRLPAVRADLPRRRACGDAAPRLPFCCCVICCRCLPISYGAAGACCTLLPHRRAAAVAAAAVLVPPPAVCCHLFLVPFAAAVLLPADLPVVGTGAGACRPTYGARVAAVPDYRCRFGARRAAAAPRRCSLPDLPVTWVLLLVLQEGRCRGRGRTVRVLVVAVVVVLPPPAAPPPVTCRPHCWCSLMVTCCRLPPPPAYVGDLLVLPACPAPPLLLLFGRCAPRFLLPPRLRTVAVPRGPPPRCCRAAAPRVLPRCTARRSPAFALPRRAAAPGRALLPVLFCCRFCCRRGRAAPPAARDFLHVAVLLFCCLHLGPPPARPVAADQLRAACLPACRRRRCSTTCRDSCCSAILYICRCLPDVLPPPAVRAHFPRFLPLPALPAVPYRCVRRHFAAAPAPACRAGSVPPRRAAAACRAACAACPPPVGAFGLLFARHLPAYLPAGAFGRLLFCRPPPAYLPCLDLLHLPLYTCMVVVVLPVLMVVPRCSLPAAAAAAFCRRLLPVVPRLVGGAAGAVAVPARRTCLAACLRFVAVPPRFPDLEGSGAVAAARPACLISVLLPILAWCCLLPVPPVLLFGSCRYCHGAADAGACLPGGGGGGACRGRPRRRRCCRRLPTCRCRHDVGPPACQFALPPRCCCTTARSCTAIQFVVPCWSFCRKDAAAAACRACRDYPRSAGCRRRACCRCRAAAPRCLLLLLLLLPRCTIAAAPRAAAPRCSCRAATVPGCCTRLHGPFRRAAVADFCRCRTGAAPAAAGMDTCRVAAAGGRLPLRRRRACRCRLLYAVRDGDAATAACRRSRSWCRAPAAAGGRRCRCCPPAAAAAAVPPIAAIVPRGADCWCRRLRHTRLPFARSVLLLLLQDAYLTAPRLQECRAPISPPHTLQDRLPFCRFAAVPPAAPPVAAAGAAARRWAPPILLLLRAAAATTVTCRRRRLPPAVPGGAACPVLVVAVPGGAVGVPCSPCLVTCRWWC